MGQIPNKTYTAPDGSVYRVEADGSITKIKSGRVLSNEPPSKYQITPDGKIYRVESDGSVTFLGNAEERDKGHEDKIVNQPSKKDKTWIIPCVILLLILIIAVVLSGHSGDKSEVPTDSTYMNTGVSQETINEETAKTVEENKELVPEVTVFRGGKREEDSFVEIILYPDGKCAEYIFSLDESSFCLLTYYIDSNKLYLKHPDSTTTVIDIAGDSFKYGYVDVRKVSISHNSHLFDEPTCFEGYSDNGRKYEAKYYNNGYCTLTDFGDNSILEGTYYIKDEIIHIEWNNNTTEDYYFNTDVYESNNVFFWKRGYFDEEEYNREIERLRNS